MMMPSIQCQSSMAYSLRCPFSSVAVSVVVLPYGMLVDELFAGLLDELFGLRWILFLRR